MFWLAFSILALAAAALVVYTAKPKKKSVYAARPKMAAAMLTVASDCRQPFTGQRNASKDVDSSSDADKPR